MKAIVLVFVFFSSLCLADMLWDQTDGYMNLGTPADLFTGPLRSDSLNTLTDAIVTTADDFNISTIEEWDIDQVTFLGFFDNVMVSSLVSNWTLQIFTSAPSGVGDGRMCPGVLLLNKTGASTILTNPNPTFDLSPPLHLSGGQYWITAYIATNTNSSRTNRWLAYMRNQSLAGVKGSSGCVRDFKALYTNPGFANRNSWVSLVNPIFPPTDYLGSDGIRFQIVGTKQTVTTGRFTSGELTTSPLTTMELTTGEVTSGEITSGAITSGQAVVTTGAEGSSTADNRSGSNNGNTIIIAIAAGLIGLIIVVAVVVIVAVLIIRKKHKDEKNEGKSIAMNSKPPSVGYARNDSPDNTSTEYKTIPYAKTDALHAQPLQTNPGSQHSTYMSSKDLMAKDQDATTGSESSNNYSLTQVTKNTGTPGSSVLNPYDQPANLGFNSFEIDFRELTFDAEIGKGSFGIVWRGTWRGGVVAIKRLIETKMTKQDLADLKREADTMSRLRPHVNVVQFLGMTTFPQICIVTEFLDAGSLYDFLHNSDQKLDSNLMMAIVKGIAAGMLHLHSEGIIHRDLAARNILLGKGMQVKITDFGLSRSAADPGTEAQTKSDTGPIKWMSPEALKLKIFNFKTDVWSFGVTLYEVVTRKLPYTDLDPIQVALILGADDKSARLQPPPYTPPLVTELMNRCMEWEAEKRPDFKTICHRLEYSRVEEWLPVAVESQPTNNGNSSANFIPTEYGAMPRFN